MYLRRLPLAEANYPKSTLGYTLDPSHGPTKGLPWPGPIGTIIRTPDRAVKHSGKILIGTLIRAAGKAVRPSAEDSNKGFNRDCHKERCEASP